jgi:LPXTG-site transpeptidase (sortase) family protein
VTAGVALGLNVVRSPIESEKVPLLDASAGWKTLVRPVAGGLITAVGIALALLILFLYAFSPLTASRDQHRLLSELTGNPKSTFALTSGIVPREGSPVALLRIPSLHLTKAVVAGTSASDLEAGPGLMPGTVLPGEAGNAVIAGRRLTFGGPFSSIGTLHTGDTMRVTDGLGTFLYSVRSVRTIASGRTDVVGASRDNRLTLITSNSSLEPTGLQIAVGKLVGRPVASRTPPSSVTPASELGLSGDPNAGWAIALWLALFILVAAATGAALWRWRRPLPTYLLALPVLVAFGLLAAEAVARALPATL